MAASQESNKGPRCGEEGGGRRALDWQRLNEKRLNQARTGLFIQNLCKKEHAVDYESVGIFFLGSPKDLRHLYDMVPVKIELGFATFSRSW